MMSVHEKAGTLAKQEDLINIPNLVAKYYTDKPDPQDFSKNIKFGTSGHRGSSLKSTFNENHILAICQAVCEIRKSNGITGPLFLGKDTHALSEPAFLTAIEVFSANDVDLRIDENFGYTPTPVISHAILTYNENKTDALADGVVITPSHNPPEDGGFKYNPPNGGPAETALTKMIEQRANEIIRSDLKDVRRYSVQKGLTKSNIQRYNFILPYIRDLENIIDMEIIASEKVKIGVDPMGGAGIAYWEPLADLYKLDIEVVNKKVDPTFSFMTLDRDGKIRMDCSSPYAMSGLINLKENFDIAFGNDPDYDRHGIVSKAGGLLNPNHFLSVAINYLFKNRNQWPRNAAIGKTLVSSAMIDRIAVEIGRQLIEVPVGFKWFVEGLVSGSLGFGGEESAGASFLRHNGKVWTTDKDGIIMDLLAAEITAKSGKDPARHYQLIQDKFGQPVYERIDAAATVEEKKVLSNLKPEFINADHLAGEPIRAKLTHAPGNNAPIGGLKVTTENGWFAARPSGTEDIYKIYAESFLGKEHLEQIQQEAQEIVNTALKSTK
jgi:phosphoglucomutase